MKKLALLTVFFGLCGAVFAQGLRTSLKDGVLLENKAKASFSQEQTYFYVLSNTQLEVYQETGSFKVADYYQLDTVNGGEPEEEYSGRVDFSFTPVMTEKGLALKIKSQITDRDGVNLKGAVIDVLEDAQGVKVNLTVQGSWTEKQEKTVSFEVLVPASQETALRGALSTEQIQRSVIRDIKHHFKAVHVAEK